MKCVLCGKETAERWCKPCHKHYMKILKLYKNRLQEIDDENK